MGRPAKAIVTKKRTVHMYAELWHASSCVLEAGRKEPHGSSWQFLSSIVLTSFAFEAYLNHVGPQALSCWPEVERLPPLAKFDLLSEALKVYFLKGKSERPYQTVVAMIDFRNIMAHGKTEIIERPSTMRDINDNLDGYLGKREMAHWEQLIVTDAFAARARADIAEVLAWLHAARPDPKEALFAFGIGSHSATAISTT